MLAETKNDICTGSLPKFITRHLRQFPFIRSVKRIFRKSGYNTQLNKKERSLYAFVWSEECTTKRNHDCIGGSNNFVWFIFGELNE